jgi:hypothetical protein
MLFAQAHRLVEVCPLALCGPVLGPDGVELGGRAEQAETVDILPHAVHPHVRAVLALWGNNGTTFASRNISEVKQSLLAVFQAVQ